MTDPWTGDRAARWVRLAEQLDQQLSPVSELLFDSAALQPGERVLDVGCGTGPTTRRAAELVGPAGAVTGVDISDDMLRAAAAADVPAGAAPIEWLQADVSAWEPAEASYDIAMSRFGVMFFADPTAAFANMARATQEGGGRLCVAVWAPRDDSEFFSVPLQATVATLEGLGIRPAVPEPDEGPFSLSDPELVDRLLVGTGWLAGQWWRHEVPIFVGGGLPPAEAAAGSLDIGPVRAVLLDVDEEARDAARDAIQAAYERYVDEHGRVVLGATVGIVTAER